MENGDEKAAKAGGAISTLRYDTDAAEAKRRALKAETLYGRGPKIATRGVKDKKLRSNLRGLEAKYKDAAIKAHDAEILLENRSGFLQPDGDLERTYKVQQGEIRQSVDVETAKKGFDLRLNDLGPYIGEYTRNGKHLLLGGRKGHVATIDWRSGKLGCEMQLGETVRDVKWLHNSLFFAVAQKRTVYIYSGTDGVELHNLKQHDDVTHMEYLPYHFLLATIGHAGYLKYTDTSIGHMVGEIPTKLGSPTAFGQNPFNAVIHAGHQNGTVTMWSPNSTTPLVKLLAHKGPVRSLAVDREGRYMVSGGQDLRMAVWDIRMFKEVNNYFLRRPSASISISDRNLTAIGWGTQVSVWRGLFDKSLSDQEKVTSPYMGWGGEGQRIERVRWCPLEDVLGVSHDKGFSSIIVPGAGEPNFDALEANPYETTKQRQEAEVKGLLNKLQPDMISLNPDFIGNLDLASAATRKKEAETPQNIDDPMLKLKNRGRGRNSSLRKYLRKSGSKNVIDERRLRIEQLRKEQSMKEKTRLREQQEQYGPALARFARKGA